MSADHAAGAPGTAPAPEISVIVPFYDDQRRLELVLAALELQDVGPDTFEVVIADDGSATPPVPGERPFAARVASHEDLGNRTGPARNVAVRRARAEQLVFIDGDTVPEPAFLREIVSAGEGEHLTVGRRRHADLTQIDAAGVRAWLTGDGPAPPVLPEPEWLAEGYRQSADLRWSNLRSYRFIISAVLACPRRLFERAGGFAEELVGYGGEDWEFARRCWLAGAELRHARRAIGWHDGPDLAGRPEDVLAVKNAETLRIARLLTDPQLRGRGLIWDHPRVVVRCAFPRDAPVAARVACVEGLLAAGDIGVWLGDDTPLPLPDPRLHFGMPGPGVVGRAELIVDLTATAAITPELLAAWQDAGPIRAGDVALAASPRDRWLDTPPEVVDAPPEIPAAVQLERWFERSSS